jgi:predicted small metal-binding protein
MGKELRCGDIIPGCDHVMQGETEDEVMAKGAQHAKESHGIEQMDEATAEKVRSAIREV